MGDPKGFMKHERIVPDSRPVPVRLRDWREVYEPFDESILKAQASRCMDCGIPFCNNGCPLGNLIPDWNDLVYKNEWKRAIEALHATNNFPEFTGRLCPAPCEAACVLGINEDPVTGSAHTLMIPYWSRILGKGKLLAQQLSTRSGKLRCELHGKRVLIGGETAKYMQGEISI